MREFGISETLVVKGSLCSSLVVPGLLFLL